MSVRFGCFCNFGRILCVLALFLIGFITPVLSSNNLPSGYTELEYIESTGTQYIDTGYIYEDEDTVRCKFSITTVVNDTAIFGSTNSSSSANNRMVLQMFDPTGNNRPVLQLQPKILNNTFLVEQDKIYDTESVFTSTGSTLIVNGTTYSSSDVITHTGMNTTLLFARHWGSSINDKSNIKMYSFSVDGKRNFIPAKRNSDSAIGMYDIVNNTFYTNSGTGTFTAGPEVNVEIKIATTKYVEDKFTPSVTELNTAISTVKTVVDNTLIQADRIGKLYTGKQNRPDDSSDSEKCPAGRDCLLITEADGTLHWYPICGADGSVEPLFVISTFLAQLTSNGNSYYYHGNTTAYNALGNTGSVATFQPSTDSIVRQLNETEWAVLWNNIGVVYGTSVCNGNIGTFAVASDTEQTETKGRYCWCKMTSVGGTDKAEHSVWGSAWVFRATFSSANCAYNCAYYCAAIVLNNSNFRSGVFGSVAN